MATENKIPTTTQAYNEMIDRVYAPVFFAKLANAWNIVPQTDDEARGLVAAAFKLREIKNQESVKAASYNNNLVGDINRRLDNLLEARYSVPANNLPAHEVKEAAVNVLQQPGMFEAALVLSDALAQQHQA